MELYQQARHMLRLVQSTPVAWRCTACELPCSRPYDGHVFTRVVSGLQARHLLGIAAWEVDPLDALLAEHHQRRVLVPGHTQLGVFHLLDRSQHQWQQQQQLRPQLLQQENEEEGVSLQEVQASSYNSNALGAAAACGMGVALQLDSLRQRYAWQDKRGQQQGRVEHAEVHDMPLDGHATWSAVTSAK